MNKTLAFPLNSNHPGLKPSKSSHLAAQTQTKNGLIMNQLKGDEDPWGEEYFPEEEKTQMKRFPAPIRAEISKPSARFDTFQNMTQEEDYDQEETVMRESLFKLRERGLHNDTDDEGEDMEEKVTNRAKPTEILQARNSSKINQQTFFNQKENINSFQFPQMIRTHDKTNMDSDGNTMSKLKMKKDGAPANETKKRELTFSKKAVENYDSESESNNLTPQSKTDKINSSQPHQEKFSFSKPMEMNKLANYSELSFKPSPLGSNKIINLESQFNIFSQGKQVTGGSKMQADSVEKASTSALDIIPSSRAKDSEEKKANRSFSTANSKKTKNQENLLNKENDGPAQKQKQKLKNITSRDYDVRDGGSTPKTGRGETSKKNFDQFLEQQKKFQDYVEEKKRKIKIQTDQTKEESFSHIPEICKVPKSKSKFGPFNFLFANPQKKSKKIVEKKLDSINDVSTVHERLFDRSRREDVNNVSQYTTSLFNGNITQCHDDVQNTTFMPTITEKSKAIIREGKVEEILYKDAMRRKDYLKNNEKIKKTKETVKRKYCSTNSEKLIVQKFLKEFDQTIESLGEILNVQILDQVAKLDYIQSGELLKLMGFIIEPSDQLTAAQDRRFLYEIWRILKGDQFQGILKRNLCLFLLSVLGLYWSLPKSGFQDNSSTAQILERDDEGNYMSDGRNKRMLEGEGKQIVIGAPSQDVDLNFKKKYGTFDENGEWEITEEEAREIHKEYSVLYLNRLHSEELRKKKQDWEYSFQPEISETSKVLAAHYRERLLEETAALIEKKAFEVKIPANGKITHTDLLVIQKKAQKAQHEKLHKKKLLDEVKDCSFRPMTNNYDHSKMNKTSDEIGMDNYSRLNETSNQDIKRNQTGRDRINDLYLLSKNKYSRKDRDRNDIDFEKNLSHCTFQPDIKPKAGKKNQPKHVSVKNVDKTIERMKIARKEREFLQQWKERGVPTTMKQLNEMKSGKMISRDNYEAQKELIRYTTEMKHDMQDTRGPMLPDTNEEVVHDVYFKNYMNILKVKEAEQEQINTYDKERQENHQDERVPLLFVDVNLGPGRTERIVVYEGDAADSLAKKFANSHGLDESMTNKLKELLDYQIEGVLCRIEEENGSHNSEEESED